MAGQWPRFTAGIDEGEKTHTVSIVCDDEDAHSFKEVARQVLPAGTSGLEQIARLLRKHADPETGELPPVTVESERGLLAQALLAMGFDLRFCECTRTSAFRRVLNMGPDKSGGRDAYALACALRVARPALRPCRVRTGTETVLSTLAHRQKRAVSSAKQAAGSARSVMVKYWPTIPDRYQASGFREKPWLRELLIAYPDPVAFKAATPVELETVVAPVVTKGLQRLMTGTILPLQEQTKVFLPAEQTAAHGLTLRSSLLALSAAEATLVEIDKQLHDALAAYRYSDALLSLPGVSSVTAARMAAGIGEDITVFATPKSLTLYAGFAPQFYGSGSMQRTVRRRNKNGMLHAAIRDWATQLVLDRDRRGAVEEPFVYSPGAWWVREHYHQRALTNAERVTDPRERAIRRKTAYNHSLRHVGARLCVGLYYVLAPRNGADWEPFDERRTFAAAYREMEKIAERDAQHPHEDRRVIPKQAPYAEEAARLRRQQRTAEARQRRAERITLRRAGLEERPPVAAAEELAAAG